tara:strand:+ start:107 stop:526 length:420 start_codon:yes stop_codon:yes gene_type:complete
MFDFSNKEIVTAKYQTLLELNCRLKLDCSDENKLDFLKEFCEDYDLDINVVKEIFDECEYPLSYDIDKDEIIDEPVLESNVECGNCGENINCLKDNIFCLNKGFGIDELTICRYCNDDLKDEFKEEGYRCDDWSDDDDE